MSDEVENITRIHLADKELILIGTAHVSKQSAIQVKEVIEAEQPDSVCIELDEGRYQSIQDGNTWRDMDIFKVIKEKKATLLLMNLAISSFQKRLAKQLDRKSTRLNSSHVAISYAVFCLKKKKYRIKITVQ